MTETTERREVVVDTKIAELSEQIFQQNRYRESALKVLEPNSGWRSPYNIERAEKSLAEADAEIERLEEEIRPFEAEFNAKRWSRFFLVPGGHIHSNMGCSSCNKMGALTRFSWLPTLSGLTEADAVAEHGAILCTVCFPTAPVEWTNGHEEAAKAKKAAQCSGSGKYYDSNLPNRTGFYSGNWATCPDCGDRQSLTKTYKIRAHKPAK